MAKKSTNSLGRMSDRGLEILTIAIIVATALLVLAFVAIGINPNIALNPFPPRGAEEVVRKPALAAQAAALEPETPPADVALATSVPANADAYVPMTWTPTATRTVTVTRTPTATRTPTSTPTETPTETPTNTPVPPTPTETAAPTATLVPTRRPLPTQPPLPTATAVPPYEYLRLLVGPNCDWFGFHGIVYAANDLPLSGVRVKVWQEGSGWSAVSGGTDGNGIYQIPINGDQANGRWWVQVWAEGPVSEQVGVDMGGGCQAGIQEVKIDWRKRR